MRKIHKDIPVRLKPYGWKVVEDGFSEETNKVNETIFTLANGYLGIRGFFEEGFYGRKEESDPSVMINGVYEYYPYRHIWCRPGFPERFHSIVNNANPIDVAITVDGEKVMLGGAVTNYSRTLNMDLGSVVRSFTYTTESGKAVDLVFTRIVSQLRSHVMAEKIELKCEKGGLIEITTTLKATDGTTAKKEEIGADTANPFLLLSCGREGEVSSVCYKTKISDFKIACVAVDECELEGAYSADGESVVTVFKGEDVKSATLYRYAALATSKDCGDYLDLATKEVLAAKEFGFQNLVNETAEYWKNWWQTSDIQIEGDDLVQQGVRFGMFMINQSAGRDEKTNVSANGLTGTAYSGHTFWDTEIFMMPMFLYSHPEEARKLLVYRYSILPKAKERAKQMDDVGALFAWNSINGEECGHVFEAATAQYHINNDVFYAIFKYYEATEDWSFMRDYGVEILMETSKCLAHRGSFIARKGGRFCINCICGPDEYNPVVDNNLYTNFLTRKQLYFTLDMVEKLRERNPDKLAELLNKCEIDGEELALWRKAADNMYLPYDEEEGIYMQDDNFIYKDPIDVDSIPLDRLPLLTHLHPLNLWRYQVCKQADIILLMFLCSDEFTPEMRKKVFDFYEPKTIHDSSLSASTHSIVACDIGYREESYGYLTQACRMDLDNVNRNTCFGIHAACMGSCYMMIVNGYAGMRVYGGKPHFKPFIPEKWGSYSFKLQFLGAEAQVKVAQDKVTYTLLSGERMPLCHGEEDFELTKKNSTAEFAL